MVRKGCLKPRLEIRQWAWYRPVLGEIPYLRNIYRINQFQLNLVHGSSYLGMCVFQCENGRNRTATSPISYITQF